MFIKCLLKSIKQGKHYCCIILALAKMIKPETLELNLQKYPKI